jgi:alpha-N-arabinofuranosidase
LSLWSNEADDAVEVEMTRRVIVSMSASSILLLAALVAIAGWPPFRAVAAAQAGVQPTPPTGVVSNASFEQVEGDAPVAWRRSRARGVMLDVAEVAHAGRRSVRIAASSPADAWWSTVVPVLPYARYRLTAWIKTENVVAGTGKGALLNLHNLRPLQTPAVTGTRDWTPVELVFDTEGNDAVQINCLFGGWGQSTGTAWYDDVRLELLSSTKLDPKVTIDAAQTRAEMSKYIYGQFIEHLGRCIYGGIWAEMLEDRKFYYAIGDKASPWHAAGERATVTMDTSAPLAGTHSPRIALGGNGAPGGIAQGELAVVAGKEYVGRIVLAGEVGAGPIQVALAWGDGPAERHVITIRSLAPAFSTVPLRLEAGATTDKARLEILGGGQGVFRVGAVSLMPADNIEGFRPDTLKLLRELDAPVYRWPGGNFVSGYNWRDGIGDRDRRPPRKNPAWQGIEHNDVGIHEFMALCRLIDAEPYIAVNSGLGDVAAAADEVEYVNGAASTPMGALRGKNGHAAPHKCRFWSIGNEMYGDWQLGHMPLTDYTRKHNAFAAAMRAKDPSIQLIGVGAVGEWSQAMLAQCAENMALISEHFYCQESPGLMGHVAQVPRQVRRIANAHRTYRSEIPALKGKDIRIALDEWNYWYGPHLYGELGTRYFLKDALGIAAGLHEYSRQSDIIFMANYAQTVNVIGAIKTSKTAAQFETTGLVLKLYRAHFGTIPVEAHGAPAPLDVAAAWRADKRALTISIVNPTKTEQQLTLTLNGVARPATARLWRIAGNDERAYNEPGKPPMVEIRETASAPFGSSVTVPPMSISLFEVTASGSV